MKIFKNALISTVFTFFAFSSHADTLLEANKIAVGDSYLLIHANYTVLFKVQAFGGIELDMNDQALLELSSDCGIELQKINQDNPFLGEKNNYFFIGGRSLQTLWLLNTPPGIQNTPCAEEALIYAQENYYETELTDWRWPRPPWQDFKADIATTTERHHFYSLNPSINPPAETLSLSETVKGNGFLGLTYYFDQFVNEQFPPVIPEMANLECVISEDEKSVSFQWPLSEVSEAQEKYFGTTVRVIPMIVFPDQEAFKDMQRCNVSYDIRKNSRKSDEPEIYEVRYSVDFNTEPTLPI